MLFHATMTHTEDNCPIYQRDLAPPIMESFDNLEGLSKKLNGELHYFTWCALDHEAYVLLEGNDLSDVTRLLFSIPMRQDIKIVPVEHLEDTIAMAKEVSGSE
jgi:hypothetical protein